MHLKRRAVLALAAASVAVPTLAADDPVFAPRGLAIRGYDPVAYLVLGRPVIGSSDIEYEWNGATWRFMNTDTRLWFMNNPIAYAPQYGGYCAWAVSNGYTASTDPDAWTIHDGKLYLNYSLNVRSQWERDIPGNVEKGDANWPGVLE